MERPPAGLREVRDFVVFESGIGQRAVHREELLLARLLRHGHESSLRHAAAEGRPGFDGQMVCRNVLHAQRDRFAQVAPQRLDSEAGHAEDQIDRYVRKSRLLCPPHGVAGRVGRMAAVHQAQLPVVERLYADRETVDPRACQPGEIVGRQIVGIGLDGTFFERRAVEPFGGMGDELLQLFGGQQRGGSAAEVDRAQSFRRQELRFAVQFVVHRPDDILHRPQIGRFVEVAVGADALAERNMEIESRHLFNYLTNLTKKIRKN